MDSEHLQFLILGGQLFESAWGAAALYVYATSRWQNGRDRQFIESGGMPSVDQMRDPKLKFPNPPPNGPLRRLTYNIRNSLSQGRWDEKVILSDLEDDIFSRGESLRELSALAILTALLFTFATLSLTLKVQSDAFATAVALVGVNWPGLASGIIANLFLLILKANNQNLFDLCREWLDENVLRRNELGPDNLQALMGQFTRTTRELNETLATVKTLPDRLDQLQTGVVKEFAAALIEGIKAVPIALSDETLNEIRSAAQGSAKLIEKVANDYASLVLFTEEENRRQTEIAAAVAQAYRLVQIAADDFTVAREWIVNLTNTNIETTSALKDAVGQLAGIQSSVSDLNKNLSENARAANAVTDAYTRVTEEVKWTSNQWEQVQEKLNIHVEALDRTNATLGRALDLGATLVSNLDRVHQATLTLRDSVNSGVRQVESTAHGAAGSISQAARTAAAQIEAASTAAGGIILAASATVREGIEKAIADGQALFSDATGAVTASLEKASDNANAKIDEAVVKTAANIADSSKAASAAISESTKVVTDAVTVVTASLERAAENANAKVDEAVAKTAANVADSSKAASAAISESTKVITDAVTVVTASLEKAAENANAKVDEAVAKTAANLADSSKGANAAISESTKVVTDAVTVATASLERAAENANVKVDEAVAKTAANLADSSKAASAAISENTKVVTDAVTVVTASLEKAAENANAKVDEAVTKTVASLADSNRVASAALTDNAKTVTDEMTKVTASLKEASDDTSTKIDEAVVKTTTAIADAGNVASTAIRERTHEVTLAAAAAGSAAARGAETLGALVEEAGRLISPNWATVERRMDQRDQKVSKALDSVTADVRKTSETADQAHAAITQLAKDIKTGRTQRGPVPSVPTYPFEQEPPKRGRFRSLLDRLRGR